MENLLDYAQQLGPGALNTLVLTALTSPLAAGVAVMIAVVRVYHVPLVAPIARAIVELIRSTPLLLQLFFMFFVLPFVGIFLDPWPTAILTITVHFGAYQSEIVRAAILSVPVGLLDASRVLSMSGWITFKRVVAPLALRVTIPPMANSLIELFKATSIVSLVGVHEIVFLGQLLANRTFDTLLIFFLITCFYVAIGYPAARLVRVLEKRVALPAAGS